MCVMYYHRGKEVKGTIMRFCLSKRNKCTTAARLLWPLCAVSFFVLVGRLGWLLNRKGLCCNVGQIGQWENGECQMLVVVGWIFIFVKNNTALAISLSPAPASFVQTKALLLCTSSIEWRIVYRISHEIDIGLRKAPNIVPLCGDKWG